MRYAIVVVPVMLLSAHYATSAEPAHAQVASFIGRANIATEQQASADVLQYEAQSCAAEASGNDKAFHFWFLKLRAALATYQATTGHAYPMPSCKQLVTADYTRP